MGYFNELSYGSNRNRFSKKNSFSNHGPFEIEFTEDGITSRYLRGHDVEAVENFNKKVRAWGREVKDDLISSIQSMVENDANLSQSLKSNTYQDKASKEVYRVGFSFLPEGVYIHLGVGRGYRRQNGNTVRTTKINSFKERRPIVWFNPVIREHIKELSAIVSEYSEDLTLNYSRIYINS
jgi:hypothetical protein